MLSDDNGIFCYNIFEQSYTVYNIGEACSHINACIENKTELLINVMHARNHFVTRPAFEYVVR